jgi:acetoacetyl-CoA synthetase
VAIGEDGRREEITRGELSARARRLAFGFADLGVRPGDRVVALMENGIEAIVACLATTGLGAIWSSVSPDLGVEIVRDRFTPLAPSLFVHEETRQYHGVSRDLGAKARMVAGMLPTPPPVVSSSDIAPLSLSVFEERWPRFPWNHPLFILFTSGTTGPPKCIVHGAGGTLIEHVKEHRLHGDLSAKDRIFFSTTTGWMMWNWQLSALATGASIVVYDGSPTFPDANRLWDVAAREKVTVLGTSPTYLYACRAAGVTPRERVDLKSLRAILSTGSILSDPLFEWVAENVKDVPLQSISGGTDIIGCFALGHPDLPVRVGELQCLSLGLDVRAHGASRGKVGELVCARPFPSRPLGFWGDPGPRFHESYFAQHPGVWTHGDLIELTPHGGAKIHGRSDGILNVRGVRIGPAEIVRALSSIVEIYDAMALEQTAPEEPGGSRLVLLVVLTHGRKLDRPLTLRIKKDLSQRCSPSHVPQVVAQVSGLPTTHSGKRSERAARDALHRRRVANLGELANPAVVREIAEHPALRLT